MKKPKKYKIYIIKNSNLEKILYNDFNIKEIIILMVLITTLISIVSIYSYKYIHNYSSSNLNNIAYNKILNLEKITQSHNNYLNNIKDIMNNNDSNIYLSYKIDTKNINCKIENENNVSYALNLKKYFKTKIIE